MASLITEQKGNTFLQELLNTAQKLATPGKGLLAADESTGTIAKRLGSVGVESTEENRRNLRELLFTTPGIEECISGVILFEETLTQKTTAGDALLIDVLKGLGIVPGIKVDLGLNRLPFTCQHGCNEAVTKGLDNLAERCAKYYQQGARFAKWRAVIRINDHQGQHTHDVHPSDVAIETNMCNLAQYAVICQANGLVPILEPEVLMDGDHTLEECARVTEKVLGALYRACHKHKVVLEASVLKPNMALGGQDCPDCYATDEIAATTVRMLQRTVPSAVPAILFLSGGQSEGAATENLNAINDPLLGFKRPWLLSFSFGRALQASCLKAWGGRKENVPKAQEVFYKMCKANSDAQYGMYRGTPSPAEAPIGKV